MVSTEKMKIEMRKIGLEREAFCKKMWAETEKKRSDLRKDVKKYRERLKNKPQKINNRNKGGEKNG